MWDNTYASMVREEPGEVQVPISQKMPLLKGSPWKVLDRGLACMELWGIPRPLRINPAGRDKGKEASRGRKGVQPGSPRKASGNFPRAWASAPVSGAAAP